MRELLYTESYQTKEHETMQGVLNEIAKWWKEYNAERQHEAHLCGIDFTYIVEDDRFCATVTVEDA